MSEADKENVRILQIARDIKASTLPMEKKEEHFSKKYLSFKQSYPTLYSACMDPSFKLDYLAFMLRQKAELDHGKLDVDSADKVVYDRLRERYVDPVVRKLDEDKHRNASSSGGDPDTVQVVEAVKTGASTSDIEK